ncbi:hypothetical protein D9756_010860 [Leucocoprinus leucothites]|uniref:Protein kinase domain-containing protein n=1 Tax=Leucocoprinus leucothites TaxID=201217 RepID=A0A8H5CPY3_9AGAR|nr:hypothetical protein D9756_010860 [Leucoagaricus leucothites]
MQGTAQERLDKGSVKLRHPIMKSNPDKPYSIGYVKTTVHALRLVHAASQGVIPRIIRCPKGSERRTMIKSGVVIVFSVEESGIKRWTDGLLWSPPRAVGNFLVYREINERSSSCSGHKKQFPQDDLSGRNLARCNSPDQSSYESLTNGHSSNDQGTFKPNGLIKKTIAITIEASVLHLISYYTSEDIRSGLLKCPTSCPDIIGLYMPPHIFRLTNFRVPPKVEIGPDGKPRFVCEAEDWPTSECKVEEPVYHVPDASGSPVHSLPHGGHSSPHSNMYGHLHTSDRWSSSGTENFSLLSMTMHQELPWTSALHSSHLSIARRWDNSHLSSPEPWSSLNGLTGSWLCSHDVPSSHSSPYLEPRARIRSSGHPYEEAASIITERSQSSSSWDTEIGGILSDQDSEFSFTESEMDYLLDLSDMKVDQPSNNSVELLQLLYRILLRKVSCSALQNLQGSQVQVIIDYLYSVLLWPVLPIPQLRKHVLITLYKLCKASLLYPRCYILKDSITFCSHEGGGGFSDIHKGHLGGKEFCLKVVRLHQKSDTDTLLKARSPNKQFRKPGTEADCDCDPQSFAKEAILWGHLQHPNIVPFYGVYYVNTLRRQICLVSPWMHHGNVVEYLKRHPFVARAPLVLDVTSGLEYLHSQDVIHSDLKGANILVNDLGKACITDFGFSLVRTDKTLGYTLASSDAKGYSLRWAAPELLEDGARATMASDIWAFGCVCYEIMAGLLPFSDLSEMQVLRALITGIAPKRPSSVAVSSEAEGIIWAQMERCCQVDPKIRPNCKRILSDLQSTGFPREDSYEAQNDAMLERQLFWDAMRQGEDGLLDMTAVEQVLSELSQNYI